MSKRKIFILCTLAFFYGCKNSTAPGNNNVMMPLTTGNSWTYQDTVYGSGNEYILDGTFTITINGSAVINGKKYATFDDILSSPTRNDAQGTWTLRKDSTRSEYLEFKYPGLVRDVFNFDTTTTPTTNGNEEVVYGHAQIITTDTLITVPAGTFNCYGYEYDYFTQQDGKLYIKDLTYCATNVGYIKDETYKFDKRTNTFYLESISRLISKNLN